MTAAGNERGLSLIEMSMVMIVIVIMSIAIIQSLRNMSQSHSSMVAQTKVSSLSERIAASIEADVGHATRLFSEDADGRAYLAKMRLGNRTPIAGSRMPVPTLAGQFDVDPEGVVQTGNLLFIARREAHELIDTSATATPDEHRVDVYRFVVWFLEPGTETGVDLSRWSSLRIARFEDLTSIEDEARRDRLGTALYARGIRLTWQPSAPVTGAFRQLEPDGTLTAMSAGTMIPGDVSASELKILGTRFVGIATNGSVPAGVPKFARAKAGFPHGFEIKRDGDGSGDLVLVRLVCATKAEGRRVAVADVSRHVAFRNE